MLVCSWVRITGFQKGCLALIACLLLDADPDMLQIGNGNMTLDEQYTHMTLWAIMKVRFNRAFRLLLVQFKSFFIGFLVSMWVPWRDRWPRSTHLWMKEDGNLTLVNVWVYCGPLSEVCVLPSLRSG